MFSRTVFTTLLVIVSSGLALPSLESLDQWSPDESPSGQRLASRGWFSGKAKNAGYEALSDGGNQDLSPANGELRPLQRHEITWPNVLQTWRLALPDGATLRSATFHSDNQRPSETLEDMAYVQLTTDNYPNHDMILQKSDRADWLKLHLETLRNADSTWAQKPVISIVDGQKFETDENMRVRLLGLLAEANEIYVEQVKPKFQAKRKKQCKKDCTNLPKSFGLRRITMKGREVKAEGVVVERNYGWHFETAELLYTIGPKEQQEKQNEYNWADIMLARGKAKEFQAVFEDGFGFFQKDWKKIDKAAWEDHFLYRVR